MLMQFVSYEKRQTFFLFFSICLLFVTKYHVNNLFFKMSIKQNNLLALMALESESRKLYIYIHIKKFTYLLMRSSQNLQWPLSAAIVKAVSLEEGTGGALTSAPLSRRTRPTSAQPPEAASIKGVRPVCLNQILFK